MKIIPRVLFALVLIAALALLNAGCGGRVHVTVQRAELTTTSETTSINLSVRAPWTKEAYYLEPSFEAVLRDNLGNEYWALFASGNLDGAIGGGKLNPEEREGVLSFPVLDPRATLVRLAVPIRSGLRAEDILSFGITASAPHKWHLGAIWNLKDDNWSLASTFVGDTKDNPVAVQSH
ncbi:MAG: hypothetical protein GX956_06440 [Firmicutes bacterium]|nr:hypothetical protein [Bacillota bacterium]